MNSLFGFNIRPFSNDNTLHEEEKERLRDSSENTKKENLFRSSFHHYAWSVKESSNLDKYKDLQSKQYGLI